jgi:preprotein translocase SecY subunit
MFRRILLVFTDKELRIKLLQVILLLIAARLLAHIPIPVLKAQDISNLIDNDAVFGLLNTISGGAYGKLSFVMLGVGPYITASIVIQLLGVIVPKIKEIQKEEGELGQQKINRWTRYLAVPIGALSGWGILQFLASSNAQGNQIQLPSVLTQSNVTPETFWSWFAVIAAMTAGSIIMMWIGEIITEIKMGNGISLLILSGIVVRLPSQLKSFWDYGLPNFEKFLQNVPSQFKDLEFWKNVAWNSSDYQAARTFVIFILIFLVTLALVIYVNDAVRKLLVIYSKRGHSEGKSRTMESVKADLPIKVNMAGVLPIIFAVSFILFPTIISRFFFTANIAQVRDTAQKVENYLSTQASGTAEPTNKPSDFLGLYYSQNASQIVAIKNYDPTLGQDYFGFTLSTLKYDKNYQLPVVTNDSDIEKKDRKELRNVFFDGTFLRFETPTWNPGFLPEFSIHWNGVLAYTFYYFFLIIFFTYFYTSTVAFKTDDVAENLQKNSAYIPGFKPGKETADYLAYLSNRLNVAGSIFLAVIALVPLLFNKYISFGDGTLNGIVGGTTLLILVSVTIETLKQIEAQATAVDYDRFTKY